MDLTALDAVTLRGLLSRREVSVREVVEAHVRRIQQTEPDFHALLSERLELALDEAAAMDELSGPERDTRPLFGLPVVVKDNICTRDLPTTCASRMLSGYVSPYDATVVARLRAAGAIVLGKTNLDEFAMGSSTETSAFGPSRNPWDPERVPGGSSGGSAVAVCAGQAPLALGSDTGGSIRQPAALCGVVGLKPSYGRVSRYGLVAYASSLDQIGPMTRSVRDAALLLQVIGGADDRDTTCAADPVPDYTELRPEVSGLRIGVPREYFAVGVDPEVANSVRRAVEALVELGADAEECSMPSTEYALAAYYIIAPAEASSNLARYDGVKYGYRSPVANGSPIAMSIASRSEGFGAEVKQRIMIGTYALSAGYYDAYYRRAQQVRTLIRQDFARAFERYDLLVTPTSPTVAFRFGERLDDPLAMKLADVCTVPANMAGVPGVSVPCGFSSGLPIGLQIMGRPFDEATVLRAAYAYERTVGWAAWRPADE